MQRYCINYIMKRRRNTATKAENLNLSNHFRDGFVATGDPGVMGGSERQGNNYKALDRLEEGDLIHKMVNMDVG